MNNDKAISLLNHLIEPCKDGEYGFKTAAEGVSDNDTRSLFQQFSQQRAGMARELPATLGRWTRVRRIPSSNPPAPPASSAEASQESLP